MHITYNFVQVLIANQKNHFVNSLQNELDKLERHARTIIDIKT